MRKIKLLFLCLCSSIYSFSQDIIVMRNADEIEAKVVEIRDNDIAYKKWDFQEGPNYSVKKVDVLYIKYSNGTKEIYNNDTSTPTFTNNDASIQEQKKQQTSNNVSENKSYPEFNTRPFIKKTLFNAYAEFGAWFDAGDFSPIILMTLGARIKDYVFVGLSIGPEIWCGESTYINTTLTHRYTFWEFQGINLPICVNARAFYPINPNFSPFLDLSVGTTLWFYEGEIWDVTAKIRVGAGIEWKRLVFSLGYNCEIYSSSYDNNLGVLEGGGYHLGYFKLGVKIGKLH